MARLGGETGDGAGRLFARPGTPAGRIQPGLHELGLDAERDALLYVPKGYEAGTPAPFVLSLHGAGGNERSGLYPLHELADEFGTILLSPASRGRTWDVIRGGFGPDVAFVDRALVEVFSICAVDLDHMAIAGFSDGASYALSLGITNGDHFPAVIAFSPGFASPGPHHGDPRFFISHGMRDEVLPVNRTSRRIAPMLQDGGYEVTYLEFDGGHLVPPAIAREAMTWFLDPA